MKPTLLILAAGVGSRYGGLKQVDGMGPSGEAILDYSVFDALRAGFGKVVFVIRRDIEAEFRRIVGSRIEAHIPTEYAFQELDTALDWLVGKPERTKPWGTGHAVLAAREYLADAPFVAINADDFYGADAFQKIADFCLNHCSSTEYGMVAYLLGNTLSENGSVSRGVCAVSDEGFLTTVVERTKIERQPDGIFFFDENGQHALPIDAPVSMNFWAMHPTALPEIERMFRQFVLENLDNPRAEFYIPKIINNLIEAGKIRLRVLTSDSQWYGVTYTDDKSVVQAALAGFAEKNIYPKPLWQAV